MSITKKLRIGSGAYVWVIMAVIVLGAAMGCGASAEERTEATAMPEHIPVESDVAAVQVVPTSTPTAECPTPAEQEYLDAIESDMRRLATLTTMMAEDLVRPTENPYLYEDDLWRMTMENHFRVLPLFADALLEHDPPASASTLRALIERMVGDYKSAIELYEGGVANLDADMMVAGADKMTLSTDEARQIGAQIASFCQIRGR